MYVCTYIQKTSKLLGRKRCTIGLSEHKKAKSDEIYEI